MKAIMISIKPKWVAKILNGEKTIEVRKNKALANAIQKLIDEYGYAEIFVFCSKNEYLYRTNKGYIASKKPLAVGKGTEYTFAYSDEGKVAFKFRCYKVEEIVFEHDRFRKDFLFIEHKYILDKSCLSIDELGDYIGSRKKFYIIHLSDLEIFDKPKELSGFHLWEKDKIIREVVNEASRLAGECLWKPLTKAPQSWCYVEVER